MARANPKRFERCVTKVTRSLKKYRRPGNAYAICKASQSNLARRNPDDWKRQRLWEFYQDIEFGEALNRAEQQEFAQLKRSLGKAGTKAAIEKWAERDNSVRWNPVLPLTLSTVTLGPKILSGIEGQRKKIERGLRSRKNLTDRAKRYRAQEHVPKSLPCFACGNPKARDVAHLNGEESDGSPINLSRSCRSCNVKMGNTLRKAGLGTKTVQFNPGDRGASSLGAYLSAIQVMKGETPGNVAAAVRTVQATSAGRRTSFAKQIWRTRRERYGATGRSNSPFDFFTKKRVTYHARIVRPKAKPALKSLKPYQGKAIYKTPEGDYTTSIDRDSRHDTLKDAKDFIRSMKTNRGKRKNSKGNPEVAAREGYRGFHGHESKKLTRVITPIHEHKYLAGLGDLRKLVIVTANKKYRVKVKFTKPYPLLSMNEDRTQLFIDGGDQSVNVSDFGIRNAHEKEVLGQLTDVYYFTTKDHLRPQDGGKAVYHHKFGKIKPTMVYDVRNKLIEFAGGGYTIPDEGIDG